MRRRFSTARAANGPPDGCSAGRCGASRESCGAPTAPTRRSRTGRGLGLVRLRLHVRQQHVEVLQHLRRVPHAAGGPLLNKSAARAALLFRRRGGDGCGIAPHNRRNRFRCFDLRSSAPPRRVPAARITGSKPSRVGHCRKSPRNAAACGRSPDCRCRCSKSVASSTAPALATCWLSGCRTIRRCTVASSRRSMVSGCLVRRTHVAINR